MVLCTQVGLNTLAVGGATGVDVFTSLVGADEGDGLDPGLVNDEVDCLGCAVNNVDDTWREASLLGKLGQDHGSTRVTLRGLDNASVAGDSGDRDRPERDHGREVERADSCNNTKRLAVGPGLHVLCDLKHLTSELCGDATGGLGDLQTAQDVTLCVGESLALLESDARSETVPVLPDQSGVLEHDLLPVHDAGCPPCREGRLSAVHGGLQLGICALRYSCNEVVGCRIVQIDPLGCLGGHELVVEEVGGVDGLGDLLVGGRDLGWQACCSGLEVRGCGVESAHGNLASVHCLRHSGNATCCVCCCWAERQRLECPRRQCSAGGHCVSWSTCVGTDAVDLQRVGEWYGREEWYEWYVTDEKINRQSGSRDRLSLASPSKTVQPRAR